MNNPHLPQYFAIKRDENNPLWEEFVKWFDEQSGYKWSATWDYRGWDGEDLRNGFDCNDSLLSFNNSVVLITLKEWKSAIDKTEEMKETEDIPTSAKIAQVDFDPLKPFEVSLNGEDWHLISDPYYCGKNRDGLHMVEDVMGAISKWHHIRNIVLFHAGMLEVGEWIEITEIGPYENLMLIRMDNRNFCCINTGQKVDWDYMGKGRRVKVNITTEEI